MTQMMSIHWLQLYWPIPYVDAEPRLALKRRKRAPGSWKFDDMRLHDTAMAVIAAHWHEYHESGSEKRKLQVETSWNITMTNMSDWFQEFLCGMMVKSASPAKLQPRRVRWIPGMKDLQGVTTRHSSSLQLPTSSALQNTSPRPVVDVQTTLSGPNNWTKRIRCLFETSNQVVKGRKHLTHPNWSLKIGFHIWFCIWKQKTLCFCTAGILIDLVEVRPITAALMQRIWIAPLRFQRVATLTGLELNIQPFTNLKMLQRYVPSAFISIHPSWLLNKKWCISPLNMFSGPVVNTSWLLWYSCPASLCKISPASQAARTSSTNWKSSLKVTHQRSAGIRRWSSMALAGSKWHDKSTSDVVKGGQSATLLVGELKCVVQVVA